MSINIYLKDQIKTLPAFTSKPYPDGSGNNMRFDGINVFGGAGSLHIMLGDNDLIPEQFRPYVCGVTYYDHHPTSRSYRELGVYKYATATAEIELQYAEKPGENAMIKVRADTLEDARELIRKIKAGSIRPEESFEGSQQGMSRVELEARLSYLERQLQKTHEAYDLVERRCERADADLAIHKDRVKAVQQLAADLDSQKWPLCQTSSVSAAINRALNGAGK